MMVAVALVGVGVGVGVGAQSTNIDLAKTFEGLFLSLIETQYVAVTLGIGTPVVVNVFGFGNSTHCGAFNASDSVSYNPNPLSYTPEPPT